ncbi:hypothetical protein [Candidatus Solirubrobacter pratensis]|uniref:hypothetical protein n=1 Tax=Candidatus Solirubrobacter pratensis TaxID=1298857 RepID=UPI0012DF0DEF|nr:hypothetical protein [Candidatus Solirubrobacter pratensis]
MWSLCRSRSITDTTTSRASDHRRARAQGVAYEPSNYSKVRRAPPPPARPDRSRGLATAQANRPIPLPARRRVGGRYFEDVNEREPHVDGMDGGVAPHARDPEAAERLWQASLEMLARTE